MLKNRDSFRIVVDSDSCPVKEEIRQISSSFGIKVLFVASYSHFSPGSVEDVIYVDNVSQEVDMYIVNYAKKGDVVVTGDYGLASILLPKGIFVLSPRGKQYTDDNIDQLLAERHSSAQLRKAGKRTKGPAPFQQEDYERFRNELTNLLSYLQENGER